MNSKSNFLEKEIIDKIKHYLPAQAPLKDFIHHNTLHAFQNQDFFDGLEQASSIFGFKVCLTLQEYRDAYSKRIIHTDVLERIIKKNKGENEIQAWKEKMVYHNYIKQIDCRIGKVRAYWKTHFHIDLDSIVHPKLFRILSNFLDQGISDWEFPVHNLSFFEAIKELEKHSLASLFNSKRSKKLLLETNCEIKDLLKIVVGDENLFEYYLFDQQFSHQGWSGIVSSIEHQPNSLLNKKSISIKDLIKIELLMEIDALDREFGEIWSPLSFKIEEKIPDLFSEIEYSELNEVLHLWQEALEWSYYDEVLNGIVKSSNTTSKKIATTFQALFCIDDRECSFRRHLENLDKNCETFGTPGFFNVEFYFQPKGGQYHTKLCPAPLNPKYLIKEKGDQLKKEKDSSFHKSSNSLIRGWFASQIVGIWSGYKLISALLNPKSSSVMASSFKHMDKEGELIINFQNINENGLQIGFKIEEMADRVEGLLKSIGLVSDFANIVYLIGHGSSSVNNPHYSAYDCGACCGRPGSVNARVAAYLSNKPEVRQLLQARGINIPDSTQFIGALHDTSRDEIEFFDTEKLYESNKLRHKKNEKIFQEGLAHNAKERARRFVLLNHKGSLNKIHKRVKQRSVALFETRPEYNHATNALCIIGRRSLTENLFLDRRAFLNSYEPSKDLEGKFLSNILKAAAPVCGGINLEYFFSRMDNQKLGAGSKLPHNVMGLIGVANGSEGDLRPGLPRQMIEIHDPLRLLIIVEQKEEIVLNAIQSNSATYEWFKNNWINLACIDPDNKKISIFNSGNFNEYQPCVRELNSIKNLEDIFEFENENLPIYHIEKI